MPEQVRIFIESKGLDSMIKSFKDLSKPPSYKVTAGLEGALGAVYAHTQGAVHVISGRLKASGYTESDFNGWVWSGSVNYGGRSGTPAYYAIYEMSRGGTRPDGTPHDFFAGLDAYDPLFEAAIDKWFDPL